MEFTCSVGSSAPSFWMKRKPWVEAASRTCCATSAEGFDISMMGISAFFVSERDIAESDVMCRFHEEGVVMLPKIRRRVGRDVSQPSCGFKWSSWAYDWSQTFILLKQFHPENHHDHRRYLFFSSTINQCRAIDQWRGTCGTCALWS